MRLWSLHPRYLDSRGLVALWREALLARAVLRGQTRGYRHHPQLHRFQAHAAPRSAISVFLAGVHTEALARGYSFDAGKIGPIRASLARIPTSSGQLDHEWQHLLAKLQVRNPDLFKRWRTLRRPEPHPLFEIVPGGVAAWERA